MSEPLLFLDIDGVLNRLGGQRSLTKGRGSVLSPCEDASEKVRTLARQFSMVWASQWRERAPLVWGKELGIGSDWPHLRYRGNKLTAIREYAAGRPWCWVDDFGTDADDGLVVIPDPAQGITWPMVEAICSHKFSTAVER